MTLCGGLHAPLSAPVFCFAIVVLSVTAYPGKASLLVLLLNARQGIRGCEGPLTYALLVGITAIQSVLCKLYNGVCSTLL